MLAMLDLFSGIGGFSLGFERAGFQTVAFCECDPFCRRVLAKHWPHVPIYDDVRTLTHERLAADGLIRIDIITAGFPCQPFSAAGQRRGADDDRYLWPALLAVICGVRPAWIVLENVHGLVTLQRGLVFERVLSDLEGEGYEAGALVIPACAVNAPHRRDRVWILANAAHGGIRCRRTPGEGGQPAGGSEAMADAASTGTAPDPNGPQLEKWQGQRGDDGAQQPTAFRSDRRVTLGGMGRGNDGLPAGLARPVEHWDDGWEGGLPRLTRGEPERAARLKALGNAIVPQVAERIARAIRAAAPAQWERRPDSAGGTTG